MTLAEQERRTDAAFTECARKLDVALEQIEAITANVVALGADIRKSGIGTRNVTRGLAAFIWMVVGLELATIFLIHRLN